MTNAGLFLFVVVATTAAVGAESPAPPERFLTAKEIETGMAPHVEAIGTCFKKHALGKKGVTGEVRLEMVVAPSGRIHRLRIVAPGVSGSRFQSCVEKALEAAWFANKSRYTTAVIPFLFVRTQAPGAGPLMSCWRKTGCPSAQQGGGQK
jgi:hypothetical protein